MKVISTIVTWMIYAFMILLILAGIAASIEFIFWISGSDWSL